MLDTDVVLLRCVNKPSVSGVWCNAAMINYTGSLVLSCTCRISSRFQCRHADSTVGLPPTVSRHGSPSTDLLQGHRTIVRLVQDSTVQANSYCFQIQHIERIPKPRDYTYCSTSTTGSCARIPFVSSSQNWLRLYCRYYVYSSTPVQDEVIQYCTPTSLDSRLYILLVRRTER